MGIGSIHLTVTAPIVSSGSGPSNEILTDILEAETLNKEVMLGLTDIQRIPEVIAVAKKPSKNMLNIGNKKLSISEMQVNAEYIYQSFLDEGWSKTAICGMLGNMQTESYINPGIWENYEVGRMDRGFGLVQWTPATKYIDWAIASGLDPYDIDSQIQRILYEAERGMQWASSNNTFNMSFADYTKSNYSPEVLAEVFLLSYERPRDKVQPWRGVQARYWFDNLD
jgi:hypothetical protein